MPQYRVKRVDVSWTTVEAATEEEVLEAVYNDPDLLWETDVGEHELNVIQTKEN